MIATTQCPPVEVLRCYSIGVYTDEEGDTIEAHLTECDSCDEILSQFDKTADSLVRHLPLTGQKTRKDDDSGWLKCLISGPNQTNRASDGTEQRSSQENVSEGNFGSYELCGILGQGGMGVVYEARHRQLGKPVAIKVVNPKLVAARDARRRFDREIQVLGTLQHPGIVSATDAGRIGGAAYLVMERIDGIDLSTLIRRVGPLSMAEACEICRQIALALAAAHSAQAIHRDVKPSNVMIDRTGQVKLLDFGLAHLSDSMGSRHDTSLGRLLGTLDYMAPEQADGKTVTPSVDLYGLGATLFFLLTARPPKVADRERTLLGQLRVLTESTAPRLSDVRNDVPESLSDLVAALLENDPKQRLSEAVEAATALEQFTNEHSAASLDQLVKTAGMSTPQTEDEDAVVRSLSELLGSESDDVLRSSQDTGGSWFGRFSTIAATLAGLAAVIALGIILLIRTDEGTIRIESEVAGITVELLDEEERVETLRIENQAGETQLKAGKYRVRLAGGYDNLIVEPDVIVLTKNETEVARVSVLTDDGSNSDMDAVPEEGDVPALYRGETEAVWQRRFEAETDPLAKIEAGKALISLSESVSAADRVQRIVNIGGALVQSGWGGNPEDFFLFRFNPQFGGGFHFSAKGWSATNNRELSQAWQSFARLAETTCESLELTTAASTLASTIPNTPTSEAIFATNLLDEIKDEITSEEPSACETVLKIRLENDSPMRLYLCIIQADYFRHTSPKAQREFTEYCSSVGEAIVTDNIPDKSYPTAREWLQQCLDSDIPISGELKARVAQSMLFTAPERTMDDIFQAKWMGDGSLPYPNQWMKAAREARYAIWDAWLPHLNEWLESHPEQNERSRLMLSTLNVALRFYKQNDEWPIDSLARQLTQRAEQHDPHRGGTTSHDLLSYVILAGGELPEKTRAIIQTDSERWPLPVRELADRLRQESGWNITKAVLKEHEGLLLTHPASTVAMLLRDEAVQEVRGVRPASLQEKLVWLSGRGNGDGSPPPMEPLLLLAIATELTGESEAQDERIAKLFTEPHPQRIFARHILRDAVEYPYALREVTLKWLRLMRERAVGETLIGEIDKLLPGEVRERTVFIENNPDSLLAVLDQYNRETREARTTLFDPPIPDLSIEQLTSAFQSAARQYRKLGKRSIADALQQTADSDRLADGLNMRGVSGTMQKSKKNGELTFRQFVLGLDYKTGPRSREMVVLAGVELRYSRNGWSSLDWGEVHPPLTGEWALKSVTANGEELDDKAFQTWKTEHEPWTRIAVRDNEMFYLDGETDEDEFHLELNHSSSFPTFRLLQAEKVQYSGLYVTNAFIDFTKLTLTFDPDGGPAPESYDTEESDAVRLSYERIATYGDESKIDDDTGELNGDKSQSSNEARDQSKTFTRKYDVSDVPASERDELRSLLRRLAIDPAAATTDSHRGSEPDIWFVFTTEPGHKRGRDKLAAWKKGDHSVPSGTLNPPVIELREQEAQEMEPETDDIPNDFQPSPEFPPVIISVRTLDGKPLPGAQVTMKKLDSRTHEVLVEANDKSNGEGVAIDRILPYGKYDINVKTAAGWYTRIRDTRVQFSKGLNLTFVAPSPEKRATLVINSPIDLIKTDHLQGLRYGQLQLHFSGSGRGYSPLHTPEPSAELGEFETCPSIGNGIEEVAASIRFDVRLRIPQPTTSPDYYDGEWIWIPDDLPRHRRFLLSQGNARAIVDAHGKSFRPAEDAKYFRLSKTRMTVGAVLFDLGDSIELPLKLDVPAGDMNVQLTGIYGRPTDEVIHSLNVQREPETASQLWLGENLKHSSEWVIHVPGMKNWFYRKPERSVSHRHIVRQEQALKPGETMIVSFGEADESAVER